MNELTELEIEQLELIKRQLEVKKQIKIMIYVVVYCSFFMLLFCITLVIIKNFKEGFI